MLRIFTVRFTYNQQMHSALVTVIARSGNTKYNVKLINSQLQDLLPDGNITYEGKNGFSTLNISGNSSTSLLLQTIAQAIDNYLDLQPGKVAFG